MSWLPDRQQSMTQDDSPEEEKDNRDTVEAAVDKEMKKATRAAS
jgi:hypothetical protein